MSDSEGMRLKHERCIEQAARADERLRIAKHLKAMALNVIKDPASDGIDGYTGAVILDLADEIERDGV